MRQQPELTVGEVPTDDLVSYARNAKVHTNEQIDQIVKSIEEFGFNDPIAVWHNEEGAMEIIEGHGRVLAAKKLGLDVLPVVTLDHLTNDQRRAYTHVHNQLTMNTGWDLDALSFDLDELDFDFEDFGFSIDHDIAGEPADGADDVPDLPETAEPRCAVGQVWKLGDHRLMCGDSTSEEDVATLMGGGNSRSAAYRPSVQRSLRGKDGGRTYHQK